MFFSSAMGLFFAFATATASEYPDYCRDDFNCMGLSHIGCNNSLWKGDFGRYCKNASNIKDTPEIISVYLNAINMYRNQQALGKTSNYDPAAHMATVSWDQNMADLASLNARECTFKHDKCRNTVKYKWSGQTISLQLVALNKCYTLDDYYIRHAFAAWFAEAALNGARYGWMDAINHFPKSDRNHQIGHFCQLVRDVSDAIGCASTKYITKIRGKAWNAVKTTCNYAQIVPFVGNNVYVSGPTASMCKTGSNSQYPGLCSEKEIYENVGPKNLN